MDQRFRVFLDVEVNSDCNCSFLKLIQTVGTILRLWFIIWMYLPHTSDPFLTNGFSHHYHLA